MDKATAFLLLTALIPAASGLVFDVEVGKEVDASTKSLNYSETADPVQEIGLSVYNTGSIGCSYQLEAQMQHNGKTLRTYSRPQPVYEGETERLTLEKAFKDWNGTVKTRLKLHFCGKTRNVSSFSFQAKNLSEMEKVESRTVQASNSTVEVAVDADRLVPLEKPAAWKTYAAEVENGRARIHYDPSIFEEDRELRYATVKDSEVTGTTAISFEERPRLPEKIRQQPLKAAIPVLIASLLLNAYLYLKTRPEWLKALNRNRTENNT